MGGPGPLDVRFALNVRFGPLLGTEEALVGLCIAKELAPV